MLTIWWFLRLYRPEYHRLTEATRKMKNHWENLHFIHTVVTLQFVIKGLGWHRHVNELFKIQRFIHHF